jgi:hypothetical protein
MQSIPETHATGGEKQAVRAFRGALQKFRKNISKKHKNK